MHAPNLMPWWSYPTHIGKLLFCFVLFCSVLFLWCIPFCDSANGHLLYHWGRNPRWSSIENYCPLEKVWQISSGPCVFPTLVIINWDCSCALRVLFFPHDWWRESCSELAHHMNSFLLLPGDFSRVSHQRWRGGKWRRGEPNRRSSSRMRVRKVV